MINKVTKILVYPKNVLILHHNTSKKSLLFYGNFGWIQLQIPNIINFWGTKNLLYLEVLKSHMNIVSLYAQLLKNALLDVSFGYSVRLQLKGVGYKFRLEQNMLHISLGYSHPVFFLLPLGVCGKILDTKGTLLKLTGISRQNIRTIGACICRFRLPDAYKGKGIRFKDKGLLLKPGKKTYQ